MSGLAPADAGPFETIASFALPLAAGAAAAVHPAGARGLAGLTSGVNTMLATREFGRREQSEQQFSKRLSDLLQEPTGAEIPTGEQRYEGTPAAPGSPEEAAGQGALLPVTRQQRLSDLPIGKLAQAMTAQPGFSREAASLLASQIPKPQYHVIQDYDPATGMLRPKSVDISRPGYLGQGMPFLTYEQYLKGEQGAQPTAQPPTEPGTPEPPPGPPTGGVPPGPISEGPAYSPTQSQVRATPAPKVSTHYDPSKGAFTVTRSPGEFNFGQTTIRGADGRNYVIVQPRDPVTGAMGPPQVMGEAQANDKQTELENRLLEFPGLQRGTPIWRQLAGEIANISGPPELQAETMADIRRRYARYRMATPQSGAPENAPAQPRAAAPASSYSPTQAGVIPAPAAQAPTPTEGPIEPADYQAIQERAARTATRQAATRTAAEASAGVTARAGAERALPMEPKESSSLLMPNGQSVPTGMTRDQAIAAGAREVTPQMREQLAGLDQARAIISSVDAMTKPLIQAKTPLGAVRQQAVLQGGAFTKTNPLAAMYLDSRQSFNGVLSRAIGGERGVLTDRDIVRITNSFPGFGDTGTIRDAKINMLRILLETATEAQKRVVLGSQSLDEARTSIDARVQEMIQKMESGASQGAAAPSQAPQAATKDDFARARRDAKGDPQKTIDLLQQRGFDPLLEVK